MVEIRYGEQFEVTDLAGQTVREAREQFRAEFGIPDKARARLNGGKVNKDIEPDTILNDDDRLSFAVTTRTKAPFLIGALLLVLAATGGVFAFGFINASTTLNATVQDSNFADVSANTDGINSLTWTIYGFFKGAITPTDNGTHSDSDNGTSIFNIDTTGSEYTGDLVVTVSIGNADQLAKKYRVFALKLTMTTPDGEVVDINEDGLGAGGVGDPNDWAMLTLGNGEVSMFPKGSVSDNVVNVRVKSGFYITHARPHGVGAWLGTPSPDLFCEVAQR